MHNTSSKKKYTIDEVVDKYKEEYERNLKFLKKEHDKNSSVFDIKIASLEEKIKIYNQSTNNEQDIQRLNNQIEIINKQKTNSEYITIAIMEAEKVWLVIKVTYVANENFLQMTDEEKIEMISKDFKEFYNNFPIVSRYMVCMGQYNQKAFKKFLKKCEDKLSQHNVPNERKKDYMQTQWIECQASYIKYLWELLQTKRFSQKDANNVWKHAYESLTKEFKDFKESHSKIEENIKVKDKKNKVELLTEAVKRISSNKQTLNLEDTRALVNKLKLKKYHQNYENVVEQIKNTKDQIEPLIKGYGKNFEAQYEYEEELKKQECKTKYKKLNLAPQMF